MNRSSVFTLAAVVITLFTSSAYSQHAKFVLFGDPNPAAAESPAEHRFVHPITAPFTHEDAFVTSDVRLWYLYHDIPTGGTLAGGAVQGVAAQLRLALTDTLQLVAYKDGYLDFDTGLIDASGLADVAAGLKWNFI